MKKIGKIVCVIVSIIVLVMPLIVIFVVPYFKPLEITGRLVPYNYILYGDHAEIVKYTGEEVDVVIPEKLLGHTVTVLGRNSFIGKDWVEGDEIVRSVIMPDCVEEIGPGAFWGCKDLEEVKLSAGLKVIDVKAFLGCDSLKSVEFPEHLEAIYDMAFADCSLLTKIEIPEFLYIIRDGAFNGCISLEEVTIPSSVQKIGANSFKETPWLESQTEEFVTAGNNVLIKYNGTDTVVEVPDGVTYIGEYLFDADYIYQNGPSITKVVLPESVTEVGFFAFVNCTNLKYIVMENENIILDGYPIDRCDKVTIVSAQGSTGQKYAEENGLKWMELEE